MGAARVYLLTSTLPGSRTRAVWLLALFAAIQLADAMMTTSGVGRLGIEGEGNPLLRFYAEAVGIGVTVAAAKVLAVAGAAILYARAQHFVLTLLTLGYVLAALLPWAWALTLQIQ